MARSSRRALRSESLMYSSVDDLVRADIQGIRDWYFGWLLAVTGLVALGVFVEGLETCRDLRDAFRRYRNPEHRESPRSLWMVALSAIGWALIVGGVSAEGVFEGFVSRADAALQEFNNILLVDARRQASGANERAEYARR